VLRPRQMLQRLVRNHEGLHLSQWRLALLKAHEVATTAFCKRRFQCSFVAVARSCRRRHLFTVERVLNIVCVEKVGQGGCFGLQTLVLHIFCCSIMDGAVSFRIVSRTGLLKACACDELCQLLFLYKILNLLILALSKQ